MPTAPLAIISSRRHPVVERARRLARGRTDRDAALLLDGWHQLADAVAAGHPLELTCVAEDTLAGHEGAEELLARVAAGPGVILWVTPSVLEAMSPVRTPSGPVSFAQPPETTVAAILRPPPALVLVAVHVQDPGNLGAIVRVADASEATGVIAAGTSADPFAWKALRGSMGSIFRVPVVRSPDLREIVETLRGAGVRVLATATHDATSMRDVDFRTPTAVLLGREGSGLDPADLALADARVCIPMRQGVNSLNVATAAAVIAYEARRQRELVDREGRRA